MRPRAARARVPRPTPRGLGLITVTIVLLALYGATGATGFLPVADLVGLPVLVGLVLAADRAAAGRSLEGAWLRVAPAVLPVGDATAGVVHLPAAPPGTKMPPLWIEDPRQALRPASPGSLTTPGVPGSPGSLTTPGVPGSPGSPAGPAGRRWRAPLAARTVPLGAPGERHGRSQVRGPLPTPQEVSVAVGRPRRGVFALGPLVLWTFDPLGLFGVPLATLGAQRLVVHPPVATPPSLPARAQGGGADPGGPLPLVVAGGSPAPGPRTNDTSGELFGLRPYVPGDRLHLISWPVLARTGQLLVRDFQPAEGPPLVVVVDDRPGVHRRQGFEDALSAVASLAAAATRSGQPLVLGALSGPTVALPGSPGGLESALTFLAGLEPAGSTPATGALGEPRSGPGPLSWQYAGPAVVVTTAPAARSLATRGDAIGSLPVMVAG